MEEVLRGREMGCVCLSVQGQSIRGKGHALGTSQGGLGGCWGQAPLSLGPSKTPNTHHIDHLPCQPATHSLTPPLLHPNSAIHSSHSYPNSIRFLGRSCAYRIIPVFGFSRSLRFFPGFPSLLLAFPLLSPLFGFEAFIVDHLWNIL